MKLRKIFYLLFAAALTVLWLLLFPGMLPREILNVYLSYFYIVRALTVVVAGFFIVEGIASLITRRLKHIGREVYLIRNVILVIGYIVIGFGVLALFEVTGITAVAWATVSGLVIGLGLQPILANLFAGLIIFGTGFLKPGTNIKISGGLPLAAVTLPAYKMFSINEFIPTLRGTIVEVGLMHTKLLSETGEIVKIANNIIFSNSIVMEEKEEPKTVRVRYEFPIEYDPDVVLTKLKEALNKDFKNLKIFIEEQSDKNYYITIVVATTPPNVKIREYRSELLKRIIKVHGEIKQSNIITA